MELAFRESLKKMRGTKSKEKFSQELEMSRSNYSLIESGKSDPTLKTLERIAELTNSTLVIDLIPNPDKPEKLFLFSTPCVILKKKGVFICYSLINTLIKFMASLPVMTA
ncbi:helix-turn-helix transcriptional regulator [Clostridioides difficile]|uniref:helix-turn-helix transcriptional regulator n=1 Tax=Clostridioides difficile TaxID=1496 RepID=UPI0031BA28BA